MSEPLLTKTYNVDTYEGARSVLDDWLTIAGEKATLARAFRCVLARLDETQATAKTQRDLLRRAHRWLPVDGDGLHILDLEECDFSSDDVAKLEALWEEIRDAIGPEPA